MISSVTFLRTTIDFDFMYIWNGYRSNDLFHAVQPDLGPSFSKQSPSKEATYQGIRTIIPSFTSYRNNDVKSQNHKVFKESRSFDLSVLGNPSRALGTQKGAPKIFQCSFDNEDSLFGNTKNNSKDKFTEESITKCQTDSSSNQLTFSNLDPR